MTELVGMMVGNYFLLERLSREGMAETYRARPTLRGGCDVILRLYRPPFPDPTAFRAHFASEVEKLWRCQHPHILPLLEFGSGDDLLFTVTHFPECETLDFLLTEQQAWPVEDVLGLTTQLCEALDYIHAQGIVHGNIQPTSIFFEPVEGVRLTNFGVRHAYQEGQALTAELGEGNPEYTAPEQSLGIISPASDLYALGVLLFRLLTGTVPYHGGTSEEVALKHANEPIPTLRASHPELPETLELVVRVVLSKTPEARFPSAAALAEALRLATLPVQAPVVLAAPQRRIEVHARRTRAALHHAV